MSLVKLIAIVFFAASVVLGALALKGFYDAHTEERNTDVSRASHVITEGGSYQYLYHVDDRMVARLKADARSYGLYFVITLAIAAILWGLAEISDKLRQKSQP